MILGAFLVTKKPNKRGDTWRECLNCMYEYADAVNHIIATEKSWPTEFDWPIIGKHFQKGYESTVADAVIHHDADFIFHEKDYSEIREAAERMLESKEPAMSMYKYQFVLPDRYNLKSRLVVMVNKRDYGHRIRFDSGGDLAQPSLDGKYISPDSVPESKVGFWNYEKILKTKEQIMDDVGRMERAYKKHFGRTQYGSDGTDENAYTKWYEAQTGKLGKPQQHVPFDEHPEVMKQTIRGLSEEQWGYSGFGYERNDYVK